ncbi:MAG: hypothetical protein WKF40_05395 [Thermoleophilaceae bacterium]
MPQARGIAPRVRVGRSRWFNLLWLLPIGFVVLIAAVAAAKGLRSTASVQRFIERLPRHRRRRRTPSGTRAFRSGWDVQHFFNLFLMIFIIRSGVQILSDHPRLYWTRHSTPGKDWFRVQKPVPADPLWTAKKDSISLPGQVGLPGIRHSIGLARWWHLGIDTLWLLNGLVFYVLLFATAAVAASGADELGRLPQRRVGADPVPVAGLADRERVGGLQQPAADRLLHHGLRRRPARADHRPRHVTRAVDPLQADQHGAQHPDGPLAALPRAGLVPAVHRDPRHLGVHHRPAAQPQPHLRRPKRRQLGRLLDLRGLDGRGRSSAGSPPPCSPCATPGWCSASATR